MTNTDQVVKLLIKRGKKLLRNPYEPTSFTKIEEADKYLNDLDNFPHHFILGCVMDRQIKAERAWAIPYYLSKEIGSFDFEPLIEISKQKYLKLFNEHSLHRFNDKMSLVFYNGVQRIHKVYNNDVSLIWKNNQGSASIVRQFMRFNGVGIKIATMTANILARDFKIPMRDKLYIEISPDVQVKRVFKRIGLIGQDATNDELIFCARELYPKYPGIFDFSAWEIGRNWCRPTNPKCNKCYLNENCNKILN